MASAAAALRLQNQANKPELLAFCCRFHPVEGDGQETVTVLVVVRKMVSNGAPGVCTPESRLQKPPSKE